MSTNDGGQAFPRTGTLYPDGTAWDVGSDGMTLRDYFAAQMVAAAYSSFWTLQSGQVPEGWRDGLASESYKMADAMLKAREAA